MKKLLLAGLLVIGFSQAQAFYEKDLKTSLEVHEGRETSPFKAYHQWGKEHLPTWCMSAYMQSLNRAQYVMTFVTRKFHDGLSFAQASKAAECGFDVLDMHRQYLNNKDAVAREELIKKYEARYQECLNIAKEQRDEVNGKRKK